MLQKSVHNFLTISLIAIQLAPAYILNSATHQHQPPKPLNQTCSSNINMWVAFPITYIRLSMTWIPNGSTDQLTVTCDAHLKQIICIKSQCSSQTRAKQMACIGCVMILVQTHLCKQCVRWHLVVGVVAWIYNLRRARGLPASQRRNNTSLRTIYTINKISQCRWLGREAVRGQKYGAFL